MTTNADLINKSRETITNNSNTCSICQSSVKIKSVIDHILRLSEAKDTFKTRLGKILIEEAVVIYWNDIKEVTKNFSVLSECLRKTLYWKIKRMREATKFVESELKEISPIGPCDFSNFLIKFINRESTIEDLQFLKWVVESPSRCTRVFKVI